MTLRKQARTYANQFLLLDKIGTPEMKQRVESLVSRAMKDLKKKATDLTEDSGVSPSVDEENFKDYLQMVLEEVKKKKSVDRRLLVILLIKNFNTCQHFHSLLLTRLECNISKL